MSPEVQLTKGGKRKVAEGKKEEGKNTSPFPSLLVSLFDFGLSCSGVPSFIQLAFFSIVIF